MRPRWHRPFCIALLLCQALWLNVVVPGHTRGAVSLPGARPCPDCFASPGYGTRPADAAGTCCPHKHAPGGPDGRASHCAVCYFAAVLMVPPAVEWAPCPTGLLRRLPLPPPVTAPDAGPLADYY